MDYDGLKERPEKFAVQERLFNSFNKEVRVAILLPSTTLNDLRFCYNRGIFTENTKFIFVEKGECDIVYKDKEGNKKHFEELNRYGAEKLLRQSYFIYNLVLYSKEEERFNLDNVVFHFGEIESLDLGYVLKESLKEEEIDFGYFDFCGTPDKGIISWLNTNKRYFSKDCELGFTYCISGLYRNKYGKTYKYYGINKPERVIDNSSINLIEKIDSFHSILYNREIENGETYNDSKSIMYSFKMGKEKENNYNIELPLSESFFNKSKLWWFINIGGFHYVDNKFKEILQEIGLYNHKYFEKYLILKDRYMNMYNKNKFEGIFGKRKYISFTEELFWGYHKKKKTEEISNNLEKKYAHVPESIKKKCFEIIKEQEKIKENCFKIIEEQMMILNNYKTLKKSRIDLKIKGKSVEELKMLIEQRKEEDKKILEAIKQMELS